MSDPALVLRARNLRAARGVVVAREVALTAAPGDVIAVEGPNGSGKSTLLAAAAGLLPTGSGSVRHCADPRGRPGRLALPTRPGPGGPGRVPGRPPDLTGSGGQSVR